MIVYNFEQGTPEWDAVRLGKLTGSHGQEIGNAGKGLDTYAKKVILKMIDPLAVSFSNAIMDRGNEEEPLARKAYEFERGVEITEVGFIESELTDLAASDRCGCSPDGLIVTDGMCEIKARNNAIHFDLLRTDNIDSKTVWQMQMNMLVSGRQWCDFVSYNRNFKEDSLYVRRIVRDEEKIKKLIFGISKGTNLINNYLAEDVVLRNLPK